jgi:hypothetical protein
MADKFKVAYDKNDIRDLKKAIKNMDDQAQKSSNETGVRLAKLMVSKIQTAAQSVQERRIAATGRTSKASKVGEFSFGYARQAFSGGADSRKNSNRAPLYGSGIFAGVEFGSDRYPQFRGRKKTGYFLYPTLTANQETLVNEWEQEFAKIIKEWNG